MADVLDLKRVFLSPFLTKTLLLRRLAYRAVSLPPVFFVKRVAILAMSLLGIEIRNRRAVFHRVLVGAHALKMLMVDASRISASVVYNHPILNWAKNTKPRDPMRSTGLSSQVKGSVSVFIKGRSPNNAPVLTRCSFGQESGIFSIRKVHGSLLYGPKGYNGDIRESSYGLG